MPDAAMPEVREDRWFGGRLSLAQFVRGHRVGTDAVLLAAAGIALPARRIADLGCGVGAVGLAVAVGQPAAQIVLVDNDPAVLGLAHRNVAANGCEGRVAVAEADLFARPRRHPSLPGDGFDLVLTNPPFFETGTNRPSRVPERASAHVLSGGTLAEWIGAGCRLLRPGGRIVVVHRADALPALLGAVHGKMGGIVVKAVHTRPDCPATRLLMTATKGSKAPAVLLPPLVLHGPDGMFLAEADAIHRGEMPIPLVG